MVVSIYPNPLEVRYLTTYSKSEDGGRGGKCLKDSVCTEHFRGCV